MNNNVIKSFFVVLVIILGITTISLFELMSDVKEHNKWIKTIQAPSEGRLILNDRVNCRIDSVMGDSV